MTVKDLAGTGPLICAGAVIAAGLFLYVDTLLGLNRFYGLKSKALILIGLGLLVFVLSIIALPFHSRNKSLVTKGIYGQIRHPIYTAVVFLFYPAIAIWFGSWLVLGSTILVYFILKRGVNAEEKGLEKVFGKEYEEYRKNVPAIIPRIFKN